MKTAVVITVCLFLIGAAFADTIERKFEVSKGGQLDVELVFVKNITRDQFGKNLAWFSEISSAGSSL